MLLSAGAESSIRADAHAKYVRLLHKHCDSFGGIKDLFGTRRAYQITSSSDLGALCDGGLA